MLKRLVNECRFTLILAILSPLLIKEGRLEKSRQTTGEKKRDPDNIPVRQGEWHGTNQDFKPGDKWFYVPGTSLRGAVRSRVERQVRTLGGGETPPRVLCCDPFRQEEGADRACGDRLQKHHPKARGDQIYQQSCPVCRLFGSTSQASRISLTDSNPVQGTSLVVGHRDHIGIDRFTGGGRHRATFRDQVIEKAKFAHRLSLRNFELWQLGLLAYVVRDLALGVDSPLPFQLGYGKAKGYGLVAGKVADLEIIYYEPVGTGARRRLTDLGDSVTAAERKAYDLKPGGCSREDLLTQHPQGPWPYATRWQVTQAEAFWEEAARAWDQQWQNFKSLSEIYPRPRGKRKTKGQRS